MRRLVLISFAMAIVLAGCASSESSRRKTRSQKEQQKADMNKLEFQDNRKEFEQLYEKRRAEVEKAIADFDDQLKDVPKAAKEDLRYRDLTNRHETLKEKFRKVQARHDKILEWEEKRAADPTQKDILEQTEQRNKNNRTLKRIADEYNQLQKRLERLRKKASKKSDSG